MSYIGYSEPLLRLERTMPIVDALPNDFVLLHGDEKKRRLTSNQVNTAVRNRCEVCLSSPNDGSNNNY